ncbi:hypothetical protein [Paraflavitalea sp. CAU 1676]|uniref:hypothetical protein n=1 Tax=Paraflavitalea sp. CAU 1676 TaxID=3032598 RepID=UPI0023DA5865|nr:hypothetical protein [Paraflavitalea sp. CAU 1676]MDF2188536.1 hypothetical protein [Paraflavitalea sp. CAU 1676]
MLTVHWTPVSKTKNILKNGITKSKKGLYCFPLTGHKAIDRWWLYFFNHCGVRQRMKYNGIVFRIKQQDLPAYFGHWIGATNRDIFKKEIKTVKQLGVEFKNNITWRLGEMLARQANLGNDIYDFDQRSELHLKLAEQEIAKSPKSLADKLNDLDFMTFALEDYQIVLTNSVPADRIVKLIPQGDEFGRVKRLKEKYGT